MIGTRLGPWIIDKELGRGGMGRVFAAHRDPPAPEGENAPPNLAAIKVLAAELAQDTGFLYRFQREIDALSRLNHPNIVKFYESGTHDGFYYYAMEYVAGRNFDELLHERRRLPASEVLNMALQICPALKHAHDHGIIHRDIKIQNLLRTEEGVVKLADFGVAKVFAAQHLTATGGLVGTADYVSPEQASGKPVTVRSDLYSFGVVLYALLTGRMPFQGESIVDLLHKHRYAKFERPQRLVRDVPYEMDEVVCSLLEKDPAARPANALVLMRRLEAIQRKLERKEQMTVVTAQSESTQIDADQVFGEKAAGPATLMSHLMRSELETMNRAGPIGRFLNRPIVLVMLFVLCVGTLIWGFWPMNADSLYAHGAALMQSTDPTDWTKAWDNYFEPLNRKYPDNPYAEKVQEFRQRIDDRAAEKLVLKKSTPTPAFSEAQRFYLQGARANQDGDYVTAQRLWRNVATTFEGIASEQRWVRLADKGLTELQSKLLSDEARWATVREALKRARGLKPEEAEKVRRSIEDLYRNDPAATPILQEIQQDRTTKKFDE